MLAPGCPSRAAANNMTRPLACAGQGPPRTNKIWPPIKASKLIESKLKQKAPNKYSAV